MRVPVKKKGAGKPPIPRPRGEAEDLFRGDDELLASLRQELGPSVKWAASTKSRLDLLWKRSLKGDRLAPVRCLILCSSRHARVPHWAVEALAKGFKQYLSSDATLERALFGVSAKGGRHTNLRLKSDDEALKWAAYTAVGVAKLAGHKGDKLFAQAAAFLKEKRGLHLTAGTVRKYYYWAKKRPHFPSSGV